MLKWLKKKENKDSCPNLAPILPQSCPTKFHSNPLKSVPLTKKEAEKNKKEYTFEDFIKYVLDNGIKSIRKMEVELGMSTKKIRCLRDKAVKLELVTKAKGTYTFIINRKECLKWVKK